MADVGSIESDRRKKREFYSELEQYYRRKWNATLKIPYVSGRPVDFYVLYHKVTALGGWAKVSNYNRWRDVVGSLDIPDGCAASEHAVKTIYMRYLAKFEQSQLFGETDGDNGDGPGSSLGGRSQRGRSYLSSLGGQPGGVPCARYASSFLPDHIHSGVATSSVSNILEGSHCERLIRSLKSGLPNEVDFAINVCTILSSSNGGGSQATLRLNETPTLIDLLLAHVGIFDDGLSSYRQLYKNAWKPLNFGRDYEKFWLHCVDDEDELLKPLLDVIENEGGGDASLSVVDKALFGCLSLSAKDQASLTKRVDQVANILRNFSFESDCRSALANNRTMIRYLLIAINCRNVDLQSLALDTLSNIASEINLDEIDTILLRLLMGTLSRCLHSEDKFHIVRVLESIGNLCSNERNETLLCEYLEPVVIRRMIALLAVKDIMMCVYLLECLYQMTEMGPVPCQRLAEQPSAVDTLVQLVTVEAVSFGPNGLLGMKVVEYGMPNPHTAILSHPSKSAPVVAVNTPPIGSTSINNSVVRMPRPSLDPTVTHPLANCSTSVQQPPPPFLARPAVRPIGGGVPLATNFVSIDQPRLTPPVVVVAAAAATVVQQQTTPTTKKETVNSKRRNEEIELSGETKKSKIDNFTKITTTAASTSTPTSQQAQHRGPAVAVHQEKDDKHVEQLTKNWIRQNCVADPTSRVSRGELYASYVQDMNRLHDSMAATGVTVFTNYIRQMFPSCNVRQLDNATTNGGGGGVGIQTTKPRGTLLQFDGLKFTPKSAAVKNNLISPSSSSSCSSTSPPLSQLAAQHPLMQQILSSACTPEKQQVASPAATARTVGISANILRARSDSVGTLDSGYSLPGTPDSMSSGFSGTNSNSTGFGGAINFATAGLQQSSSPKSPRKSSKAGKRNLKNRSSTPAPSTTIAATTALVNDNGLVNGSNAKNDSTTTAVCHLEVCHPAQEARTVIETGDSHEARIVRVENTIAMVSSEFYVPDNNSSSSMPSPLPPTQKSLNGEVSSNSDNSNGCDLTAANNSSLDSNSNSTPKKKNVKKKSTAGGGNIQPPLNGLVKAVNSGDAGPNSMISSGSSPSPDMESMKQNVNQSIQSIQELLAGGGGGGGSDEIKLEKDEIVREIISTPTTKPTPKKGGAAKKKKANSSTSEGQLGVEEPASAKPPAPKKKKYPKKKKVVDVNLPSTPQKGSDDSFSQASTSSPNPSILVAAAVSPSFRLPLLPPTRSQSPQVVQQATVVQSSPGSQIIVRIPPPPIGRLKYVCEWSGCGKGFGSSNAVSYHIAKTHIDEETRVCHWPHCEQTMRLRWSLVAHVQDVHCNEQSLRAAAIRRYEISICGHSTIPEPRAPPPHPGYPNDAAIVAIRRHALVNLAKEIVDESEGPVTKSIRLTSSLILRNLARYSMDGRRILRKHERMLAYLAFSRLESSAALAQCLSELNYSSPSSSFKEQLDDSNTLE